MYLQLFNKRWNNFKLGHNGIETHFAMHNFKKNLAFILVAEHFLSELLAGLLEGQNEFL